MFGFLVSAFPVNPAKVSAAACTAPTTDFGSVTSVVSIPATGSYRVWSRIQIPSTTNNSFLLEIDGTTCYTVGGNSAVPLNTWTWVDYQGGSTTNKINHNFATTGNHTVKMIGTSDGVLLDRIIFTQDTTGTNCNPPTGTGDACANPVNVSPSVTLSASPTSGTAPLTTTLTAVPVDTDGTITKVEWFRSGTTTPVQTKTAAPWTYTATGLAVGTYTYTAKATDNNGAVSVSSNTVTVTANGTTTQKPGDASGDGVVGSADLQVLSFNWGKSGMTFAQGDFSGDGTVGSADLQILSFNWGK